MTRAINVNPLKSTGTWAALATSGHRLIPLVPLI
jgi:hypothetical protein